MLPLWSIVNPLRTAMPGSSHDKSLRQLALQTVPLLFSAERATLLPPHRGTRRSLIIVEGEFIKFDAMNDILHAV